MKITLEVDVFLEFSCFTYDPRLLATWSLVPFSFLNPACTSWSSQFMYCWSLNAFEYYLASIWNEQSCLFNLYAEYIMWNARLDETQARIKTAGRSINNLRYADETTLMAVSGEELNSLLMNMKEESEKVGLKLNIPKTKIMASSPITSWQIHGVKMETVADFIFLGSKITGDSVCSLEIKRHLLLGRKVMTILDSIVKKKKKRYHFANKGLYSKNSFFQ